MLVSPIGPQRGTTAFIESSKGGFADIVDKLTQASGFVAADLDVKDDVGNFCIAGRLYHGANHGTFFRARALCLHEWSGRIS